MCAYWISAARRTVNVRQLLLDIKMVIRKREKRWQIKSTKTPIFAGLEVGERGEKPEQLHHKR
jgi:hypothetical protein